MDKPDNISATLSLWRTLHANGWPALPAFGKAVLMPQWQFGKLDEARVGPWLDAHPDHTNVGFRCGELATLDLDVENEAHAQEIKKVAFEVCGPTPFVRYGKKGMALLYRNLTRPLHKMTVGSGAGKVEFLGLGQQVVGLGIHPDTGKPYRYADEVFGDPRAAPFSEVPAVTPEQLLDCRDAIGKRLRELGYSDEASGDGKPRERKPLSSCAGMPVSPAILEAMLRCIPPDSARLEGWTTVAGALQTAPVNDPEFDGLDLFTRWSRGDLHDYRPRNFVDECDCAALWEYDAEKIDGNDESVPGIGALVALAQRHGFKGKPWIETGAEAYQHIANANVLHMDDARPTAPSRFTAMRYDEFSTLAPPELLVKELNLPKFGAAIINGETKAFKTFVKGKIGLAVARGRDFDFGSGQKLTVNKDCQGACFDFSAEAPNGAGVLRYPAIFDAASIPLEKRNDVPLFLIPDVPRVALDIDAETRGVIEVINKNMKLFPATRVAIVWFDTMSKMLGGMDMNASKDMTKAIAIAEAVQREFNCCVVIIHHPNADDPNRSHGSRTSGRDVGSDAFIERPNKQLCCKWTNGKDKDEGIEGSQVFFEMIPHMGSLVPEVVTLPRYMKLVGGRGMSDGEMMLAALVGLGCYPEGTLAAMPGDPTTGCAERALARAMQRLDGYAPLAPGEKPTVEQESAQLGSVEKWRRRIASLVKPGRKKVAEYGDCLILIRKDGNDKGVPRYALPLTRWEALGQIGQAALHKAAQRLLCAPGDEEEVPCD